MVTPSIFDNHKVALRAVLSRRAHLPIPEKLVLRETTFLTSMFPLTAVHAHFGSALTTLHNFLLPFLLHVIDTFGLWTPPQVWVQINVYISLEL